MFYNMIRVVSVHDRTTVHVVGGLGNHRIPDQHKPVIYHESHVICSKISLLCSRVSMIN